MRIIEIKEDKLEKMGELTEKMLKYGGRLMSCISEIGDEYGMSFRHGDDDMDYRDYGRYGNRSEKSRHYPMSHYGMRDEMKYRDEEEWEEINERRRRDSRGRYM